MGKESSNAAGAVLETGQPEEPIVGMGPSVQDATTSVPGHVEFAGNRRNGMIVGEVRQRQERHGLRGVASGLDPARRASSIPVSVGDGDAPAEHEGSKVSAAAKIFRFFNCISPPVGQGISEFVISDDKHDSLVPLISDVDSSKSPPTAVAGGKAHRLAWFSQGPPETFRVVSTT